jgi:hypothetical protein
MRFRRLVGRSSPARSWRFAALVFAGSALFLLTLEERQRAVAAIDGIYLQAWHSDLMMQTLPIKELKAQPLTSLWYLHIQPPMLDAVRAALTPLTPAGDAELLRTVDRRLYIVWALVFAGLTTIVTTWTTEITRSRRVGLVAAVLWTLHPSALAMATLLEGTQLSAFWITWMLYELWLLPKRRGSALRLGLTAAGSFLTRTVFQWYFLPVLLTGVWLRRRTHRDVLVVGSIGGAVMLALCLKQLLLFGTLSTTTFGGQHKVGVIWAPEIVPPSAEFTRLSEPLRGRYPRGAIGLGGSWNTELQWQLHHVNEAAARRAVAEHPRAAALGILKSLATNYSPYWKPTYDYTLNDLVSGLPWVGPYRYFGFLYQPLLVLGACIWLACRRLRSSSGSSSPRAKARTSKLSSSSTGLWRGSGLLIVVAYVFGVSLLGNRSEWYEGNRLKFFLEPTFFVFILSQAARLSALLARRRRSA